MLRANFVVSLAVIAVILTGGVLTFAGLNFGLSESKVTENYLSESSISKPDFSKELEVLSKIAERYADDIKVSGTLSYFEEEGTTLQLADKKRFSSMASGDITEFVVDSLILIKEGSILAAIDKHEKIIIVTTSGKEIMDEFSQRFDLENIASQAEYLYIDSQKQVHVITIGISPDVPGEYRSFEIHYYPQSFRIVKMRCSGFKYSIDELNPEVDKSETAGTLGEIIIEDAEGNDVPTGKIAGSRQVALEIEYSDERRPEKGEVNLAKYITVSAGKFIPSARFRDYTIYNQ